MVKYILTPTTYSIVSSNTTDPVYTGVGTSNPRYTLDVMGTMNISGTVYVNNTPFSGSGGSSSNEYWRQNGTYIYYTSGNVGIGSTRPVATLDLNTIRIYTSNSGKITLAQNNGTHLSSIENIGLLSSNLLRLSHLGGVGSAIDIDSNQFAFYINSQSTEQIRLTSNGLGIGTTNPLQMLHVQGSTYISSNLLLGVQSSAYRVHIVSSSSNEFNGGLLLENRTNGEVGIALRNSALNQNIWGIGINSNSTRLDFVYGSQSNQFDINDVKFCIQSDGKVGINTANPTYTFDVQAFASDSVGNTLIGGDLTTTNFILLGPNVSPISRGPYLAMNSSNYSSFVKYLTSVMTTLSISWWSKTTPLYTQIAYTSTGDFYWGGCLIPDGRVVLAPWLSSGNVGVFDPSTNTLTKYTATNAGFFAYSGAVSLPDGRVIFIPSGSANIGVFNTTTNTFSTIPITAPPYSTGSGNGYYAGGVLIPDGRVIFAPDGTNTVGIFNPSTNTFSTVLFSDSVSGFLYVGAVLTPDGRVIFVPSNSDGIGIFNPATNTYTTVTGLYTGQNSKYRGGVLLYDGRILFIPNEVTALGQKKFTYFNPRTNTISFGNTSASSAGDYFGGVTLSDGRVLFIPSNATNFAIFDPVVGDVVSQVSGAPGVSAYRGGVLMYDGRVFLCPQRSTGGTYFYGLLSGFPKPPFEICDHPCFNKF
jgi:streptogramin lyase